MIVEIDVSQIERDAITNRTYIEQLIGNGYAIAAVVLAKLDQSIRNATIRVGDTVNWGPQPYGAVGLHVQAIDDDGVAWCRSENGTYHTVLVSELRKPAVTA